MTIKHGFVKPLWLILASYFRTTVRNGYNTVLLDQKYVNLRILTYIVKCDVPCLVLYSDAVFKKSLSKADQTSCFSSINNVGQTKPDDRNAFQRKRLDI